MAFKVNTGKTRPKAVPTPGIRPSYVLGSRPETMRQNAVPRIKPLLAQTQYGKGQVGNEPNAGGAGFGNTGQTDES